MDAETPREKTAYTKALRCPFCHESIDRVLEEWVACERCLGRHHNACWSESGKCGSCGCEQKLSTGETPEIELRALPAEPEREEGWGLVVPRRELSEEEARRETAQLFQQPELEPSLWVNPLLAPFTLGLGPVLQASQELRQHCKRNHEELGEVSEELPADLRAQLKEARRGLVNENWSLLVFPFSLALTGFIALLTLLTLVEQSGHGVSFWLGSLAFLTVLHASSFAGYLHAFRGALRRHEVKQRMLQFVGEGVPSQAVKHCLDQAHSRWSSERGSDWVLSLLCLVPFLNLLVPVLMTPRFGDLLALHRKHEEKAEELTEIYRKRD